MPNDVQQALLTEVYLNGHMPVADPAYLLVPFGDAVRQSRALDLKRRYLKGERLEFPVPGCRGLDAKGAATLRAMARAVDRMPLSATKGWIVTDPPEAVGRSVEGRLVVRADGTRMVGTDGADRYEIHNIANRFLDAMIAGTADAASLETTFRRLEDSVPFMAKRLVAEYLTGAGGFLAPLRHRFPDGLPAQAFQPLLESDYPEIREFAVRALGSARTPVAEGRRR